MNSQEAMKVKAVRLPEPMTDRIKRLADEQDRTFSDIIRIAVLGYFDSVASSNMKPQRWIIAGGE